MVHKCYTISAQFFDFLLSNIERVSLTTGCEACGEGCCFLGDTDHQCAERSRKERDPLVFVNFSNWCHEPIQISWFELCFCHLGPEES
jgi:hypothetical protein